MITSKTKASAAKRRRKWATAIAYVIEVPGKEHKLFGLIMVEGKMQDDEVEFTKWAMEQIAKERAVSVENIEVIHLAGQSLLV